jgi:glycosyltransferase involved in cell wall biosynthesis
MKLLFVSPYPPERDGIGSFCQVLFDQETAQGHLVQVVSARHAAPVRPEVIGSLPLFSPGPVARRVRALGVDLLHVQFAFASYGTRLPALLRLLRLAKADGLPIVVTLHEVTRDTESLGVPGFTLYRKIATYADHLIVHTEPARRLTLDPRIGAHESSVSVIGLPVPQLGPARDAQVLRTRHGLGDDRIILSFGFIDPDKGVQDLITAAARLDRQGSLGGVRVVIAGTVRRRFGIMRPFELRGHLHLRQLRQAVHANHLDATVIFAGFVPNEEIASWFAAADVTVLPYRRSEQSGVGRLALAAGTPIITTNVGDLASLSVASALRPEDPDGLATAIQDFLARPAADGTLPTLPLDAAATTRGTLDVYERAVRGR